MEVSHACVWLLLVLALDAKGLQASNSAPTSGPLPTTSAQKLSHPKARAEVTIIRMARVSIGAPQQRGGEAMVNYIRVPLRARPINLASTALNADLLDAGIRSITILDLP